MNLPWRTSAVMVLAMVLLTVIPSGSSAPFKTSEEVLPKQVEEVARKQIQNYFPGQEFAGIPLLDPEIDWNQFTNWPNEFVFQGDTYILRLVEFQIDVFIPIESRVDVRPGMAFIASYLKQGTNFVGTPLYPSGYWLKDGSIHDKILDFRHDCVFGYKFYPTGKLHSFSRDDFETKEYRLEYFDRSGKQVGFRTHAGGKGPGQREWEGREVDQGTFLKATRDLFNEE